MSEVKSTPKPWKKYDESMQESIAYLIRRSKGEIKSLRTQWKSFNSIGLNGVEWQSLVVIASRPGVGKAVDINTEIPTPHGYITMKDISIGDIVYGEDGHETTVTQVTDIMYDRKCYELTFCDGTTVIADAEHQWSTQTRAYRRSSNQIAWKKNNSFIKTTRDIYNTFKVDSDNRINHSIPLANAINCTEQILPIHPYVLGYWLGNGSSTVAELYVGKLLLQDLTKQLDKTGYYYNVREKKGCYNLTISPIPIKSGSKGSLNELLRTHNLKNNKHIPIQYLRSSIEQRKLLLSGLLDSDGYCNKNGLIQFCVTCKQLAYDFKELAASLGYKPTMTTAQVKGKTIKSSTAYIINISSSDQVFNVQKRAIRIKSIKRPNVYQRYITNIKEVPSVPVKCIMVNNESHMYLITRSFLPTHNSLISSSLARGIQELNKDQNFSVLHFQFEMLGRNLCSRELSSGTNLNIRYIQSAGDDGMPPITAADLERLKSYADKQLGRKEYVIDTALTVQQIKDCVLAFYAEVKEPFVVTLDHTLLIKQSASESSKQITLQNLATTLVELKNRLPVIFIILSQLNREIDDAERQKPGQLSNFVTEKDVYGSDHLLQCCDVMIAYNRPAKYNLSLYGPTKYIIGPADKYLLAAHVLKNRYGEPSIQWYRADYATMTVVETSPPMQKKI